jgi:hypothetical protein
MSFMERNLIVATWLCLALAAVSWAGWSLKVRRSVDPFTNTQILTTPHRELHHVRSSAGHSAYMAWVLERTQRPEAGPQFHIEIYCGRSKGRQMPVSAGNTLIITLDGRSTSYYSLGTEATQAAPGARKSIPPHVLYENIAVDDWQDMARAKTMRVQVIGAAESLTAELDRGDRQFLEAFVRDYVTPAGRSVPSGQD